MKKKISYLFIILISLFLISCGKKNDDTTIPTKLASPVISVTDDVLNWTIISNASNYSIYVDDSLKSTESSNSYSLKSFVEGNYSIYVIANGDGTTYTNSEKSNVISYSNVKSHEKLIAPVIALDGYTISWSRITDATDYEIYSNGSLLTTVSTLTYTFSKMNSGQYSVYVKAIDSGDLSRTSTNSNTVSFYIHEVLTAPTISLLENIVSWDAVENATAYQVSINGTTLTTSNTTYPISATAPGSYEVKVKALGNNALYIDSVYSNSVTYLKAKEYTTTYYNFESYQRESAFVNSNNELTSVYSLGNTTLLTLGKVYDDLSPMTQANGTTLTKSYNSSELYNGTNYGIAFHTSGASFINVYYRSTGTAPFIYDTNGSLVSFALSGQNSMFVPSEGNYVLCGVSNCYIFGFDVTVAENNESDMTLNLQEGMVSTSTNANYLIKKTINNTTSYSYDTKSFDLNDLGTGIYEIYAYQNDVREHYTPIIKHVSKTITEKLEAPIITMDDNVIRWSIISNADKYEIYINGLLDSTTNTLSYTFAKPAGNYEITIKAVSNEACYLTSDASNSVSKVVLAELQIPVVEEGTDRITWTEVLNAISYTVLINNVEHVTTNLYYILPTEVGYYTIQVKSNALEGEYLDSAYTRQTTISNQGQLSAPLISVLDGIVTWESITSATLYYVFINQEFNCSINEDVLRFELSNLESGTYSITIQAIGDGELYTSSELSNTITYVVLPRLVSPVLSVSNAMLTWTNVNAVSYDIYLNGEKIQSQNETNYDLSSYTEYGSYVFSVVAVGDGISYRDSLISSNYTYLVASRIETPVISITDNHLVITKECENADYYNVYLNGEFYKKITSLELDIEFPFANEYEVYVIACNNNPDCYLNSINSNVFMVTVNGIYVPVSDGSVSFNNNTVTSNLSNASYSVSGDNLKTQAGEYNGITYTTMYSLISGNTISLTIEYKAYVTITYYANAVGGNIRVGSVSSSQISQIGFGSFRVILNAGTYEISNYSKTYGIGEILVESYDTASNYTYDVISFDTYKTNNTENILSDYVEEDYVSDAYEIITKAYNDYIDIVMSSVNRDIFNNNISIMYDIMDSVITISYKEDLLLNCDIDTSIYEGETLELVNEMISSAKLTIENTILLEEAQSAYDNLMNELSNL